MKMLDKVKQIKSKNYIYIINSILLIPIIAIIVMLFVLVDDKVKFIHLMLIPDKKTALCIEARNYYEKKGHEKTYIYRLDNTSFDYDSKLTDYFIKVARNSFGSSFLLYNNGKTYITYRSYYDSNPRGDYLINSNRAVEDRLQYGFKETTAQNFCDLLNQSQEYETESTFISRMYKKLGI